jgi:ABC transporter, ATP-binding protein EcsA
LEVEKQKGKSILMSTHVLDSAEKMCDSFVILHKGQVRAKGNLEELREAFSMPQASLNDIYLALTKEEDR